MTPETTTSDQHEIRHQRRHRVGVLVATAMGALALTLGPIGIAGAGASPRPTTTPTKVVMVATRGTFGKILVNRIALSLYTHPGGACTGSCLSIWPALLMPKGTTLPGGAKCLGTATFGTAGRLQVTYQGQKLYRYTGDSGTSVNGNGVAGFTVAKVSTACP